MQIGHPAGAAQTGNAPANANVASLRMFVFALFFIFGGITSLNDVIIPKLKDLFTLSYAQAMLVQSAFFAAYFIVSLPAAAIVRHIGYMRTAVVGLLTGALAGRRAVLLVGLLVFGLVLAGAALIGIEWRYRFPLDPLINVVAAGGLVAVLAPARAALRRLSPWRQPRPVATPAGTTS